MSTLKIPTNGESSVNDARLLTVYALEKMAYHNLGDLPDALQVPAKFSQYILGLLEKVLGER